MSTRPLFTEDHEIFRSSFRKFVEAEVVPHQQDWWKAGQVSREVWLKAGEHGFLCPYVDEQYGGLGLKDWRYAQVMTEELSRVGESGFALMLHNDVIGPYLDSFANDEQKTRWLPKIVSGEGILAIAMTEPSTGSDLKNIKTRIEDKGDHYLLNGSKIYISNGILADIVIVAAQHEGTGGISLIVVERGMEGFVRGRKLDKMGMHSQDTAELFFQDVKVPKENLLGLPGMGFMYMMQKLAVERLACAIGAISGAQEVLNHTINFTKDRVAFGKPVSKFQNTRFKLAEMKTEITIGQTFIDSLVLKANDGTLSPDEACMAKYWTTDLLNKVCYEGLQLHGGAGYMMEYPVARATIDARIMTIFAGTNEIMKEVIGRSMGL